MINLRFSAVLVLVAAITLTACQENNSISGPESTEEAVTSAISKSKATNLLNTQSSTQTTVLLDAGAHHVTAYYPQDGNYTSWADGKYPNRSNYGLYVDEVLDGSVIDFKSGDYTNCVLNADGTTTCVGYLGNELSYNGQFGPAVSFDVGYGQSCVITGDGGIYCYGSSLTGTSWAEAYHPAHAEEGESILDGASYLPEWIIMSSYAVCAKFDVGNESSHYLYNSLACSGWNVTEPIWQVEGTPSPNGEGHYAMCILTEEGNIDCMNNTHNNVGQTAGYYGGDVIAFDANFDQACYVKQNGDIGCFGRNTHNGIMSFTGVNATTVSVSNNNDICYATASGDITCTRSTPDEYGSSNTAPVANAGSDQNIEATGATTSVTLDGSASSDADGDALTYSWSNGATSAVTTVDLGVGTHTFTLTVNDGTESSTDEVTITITDTTSPDLTFTAETNSLWPPNHKMVLVVSGISANDIVDGATEVVITVTSNEDSNGNGDGNTDEDYNISANLDGTYDVYVRAERSGNGNGRLYTISMQAMDSIGNTTGDSVEVSVAKNKGNGKAKKKK